MTSEQLHAANKVTAEIAMIDELENEVERFRKQRFSGSLPVAVSRFIASDGQVALKVCDSILAMAIEKRSYLQKQLDAL